MTSLLCVGLLLAASTAPAATPSAAQVLATAGADLLAKGERAAALDPSNSELHRQLGEAYAQAGQKAGMLSKMSLGKKSLAAYEKAVALDPENLAARSSLASIYLMAPAMMGGGSEKAYAQAAEIKKRDASRGRVTFATLYAGEKKYAEAFAEIEEVLKTTPDHYAALYQFGRLAALSGDRIDRGIAALKQSLAQPASPGAPGHDAAHWRLGNLQEKKGDKAAARAAYEASLQVNPKFPQAIDSLKKLD